jgi:hypothetical protein
MNLPVSLVNRLIRIYFKVKFTLLKSIKVIFNFAAIAANSSYNVNFHDLNNLLIYLNLLILFIFRKAAEGKTEFKIFFKEKRGL